MAYTTYNVQEDSDSEHIETKYVFNKDYINEYKAKLSSPEITQQLDGMISKLDQNNSYQDIESCFDGFVKTLDSVCEPLFEKKLPRNSDNISKKVQVGKDEEKAQPERDSHSKNRGGKKPNQQLGTYTMKHIVSRMSSYFPNRWPLSYLNLIKNMKTHIRRQQHKKN